jgi:hypothetical protein
MALGAHSDTYNGVSMEAAPTPRPAVNRPTYMAGKFPVFAEPVCMMTPTMVIMPVPMRAYLRPQRSVSHGVTKQAAKQPACRVDATRLP